MGKKQFTEQAFFFSLQSFKQERRRLIADSLGQSADLYEALDESRNAPLRDIEFERYELLSLKRHWDDAMVQINELPETEHYSDMKLFVKSYRRYIADIKGTMLDMNFLDANLEGLERLLATGRNWEENLKKCRNEFLKSRRLLDDEIARLRKAGI